MGRRLKVCALYKKNPSRKGWDFFCNSKFKIQNSKFKIQNSFFYKPLPM